MKRCLCAILLLALAVPAAEAKPRLKRFKSCQGLVNYAQRHQDSYQPGGPPDGFVRPTPVFSPPMAEGAPQPAAAPTSDSAGGDFSLTNNQEAGVFEPDIVKTDGSSVYAITSSGLLKVVDVRSAPTVVGTLSLAPTDGQSYAYDYEMLLYEGKLLVTWGSSDAETGAALTTLALVDVANPAAPTVLRTLTVNGSLLAERRTKSTVRAVLSVRPRAISQPAETEDSSPGAWLPRGRFFNARRGTSSSRRLVGCRGVRRSKSFTGLEELTVLTIDFDQGLDPVDADAVMTGGETVYASAQNLYVATQRYQPAVEDQTTGDAPPGQTTQIHRFSLDNAAETTYRGSGSVPGYALNQFALSEHENVLRVATTDTPPWFRDSGDQSQSYVTTLSLDETAMSQLGQVGGLGKGERIYAVRFLGTNGYVVTFRQVDPLYTVDLADPANPVVRGELKIPGFSSYLHPVAGDRLIGIGTGPNDDGSGEGLQVSLFDVSDLANPRLEQRKTYNNGSSEVAYDHHAFLWWQPRELAVLPVEQYEEYNCAPEEPCPAIAYQAKAAAVGLTVKPDAITEVGRVEHGNALVRRSIVIGDRLITMSDRGLGAVMLDTFQGAGFADF